jgi:16S rRNA (guanine527-N7)-methyltransferase
MKRKIRQKPPEKVWADFIEQERLTDDQVKKFQQYEALLSEWNRSMNLTAIRGLSETVHRHFSDSLILRKFLDLSKVNLVADVGSGAGFPGIPLKIMFPHLGVILIEVSKKKQKFLHAVIAALGLENIEVCDLDWRTFLRKTESDVEYFLARASLDPVELCRVFKPGCSYKDSKVIYWATEEWGEVIEEVIEEEFIKEFVQQKFPYTIKRRKRKLVLFGRE